MSFSLFSFFFHINFIAIQTAGHFEPPPPFSASTTRLQPPLPVFFLPTHLLPPLLVFCLHCSIFCLHCSFSASTAHFLPPPPVFCLHCPFSASISHPYHPFFVPILALTSQTHFQAFSALVNTFCTYYQLYYCLIVLEIWFIPIKKKKFVFIYQKMKTLMLNNKFKSGVPPKLRSAGAEYKLNDD